MTLKIDDLIAQIDVENVVLFFGAGSSLRSGSPSTTDILNKIFSEFSISNKSLSLAEASMIAEMKADRRQLIKCLRGFFKPARPTGGLSNISLYDWKAIYTTNYDELIEAAYSSRKKNVLVYNTNFDFSQDATPDDQRLYKIHGSIGSDVIDGSKSRIIITQRDYDQAGEYRDFIYQRFSADLAGSDLIIIGYSLADPDIKEIVDKALSIQAKLGRVGGRIFLLMYESDDERAALFESRGLRVAFGGIDEFFAVLAKAGLSEPDTECCQSILDQYPRLKAITMDLTHAKSLSPVFVRMFNGAPASYADIRSDATFTRQMGDKVVKALPRADEQVFVILGPSGVGKTTCARQIGLTMEAAGWHVWEHRSDFDLPVDEWGRLARDLSTMQEDGLLIIDDAHLQIAHINELCDLLFNDPAGRLRLLLTSTRRQWQPRYKSPSLTRTCQEYSLSRLTEGEVDRLLALVDRNGAIRDLVETTFGGYSPQERRRRLIERCNSDMFVCLRNIFASEKFDDIILREFAELGEGGREIYRVVSAMQNAGIRVHRQLIMRLLQIRADLIQNVLQDLDEIVSEYTISQRDGVYGWKVRHPVVASIIVKYKFFEQEKVIKLFKDVISVLSPTYDVERQTIREICNVETGIPSISDKREQNNLLRQMISIAPGERVPRHRLIRNLIDLNDFDIAETEIRLFENDLGRDGPVARYQVSLLVARAKETPGLLQEDRTAILAKARDLAVGFVNRFSYNKMVHAAYCDVGLEWYRMTGSLDVFDASIEAFKAAAARTDDPDMAHLIQRYLRKISGDDLFERRQLVST